MELLLSGNSDRCVFLKDHFVYLFFPLLPLWPHKDDTDFERDLRLADIVMLETEAVFYQISLQAPDLPS